jgi:hypothetical protein
MLHRPAFLARVSRRGECKAYDVSPIAAPAKSHAPLQRTALHKLCAQLRPAAGHARAARPWCTPRDTSSTLPRACRATTRPRPRPRPGERSPTDGDPGMTSPDLYGTLCNISDQAQWLDSGVSNYRAEHLTLRQWERLQEERAEGRGKGLAVHTSGPKRGKTSHGSPDPAPVAQVTTHGGGSRGCTFGSGGCSGCSGTARIA